MADIVAKTDAEARKRPSRTIGDRPRETDIYYWMKTIWSDQPFPSSYGWLVSHPKCNTKEFPDRNILNRIPDIWNINTNKKSRRSTKDRPGKHILPKMFAQMGTNLAIPPQP